MLSDSVRVLIWIGVAGEQKFAQGQELPRDLTVLILEVKEKVIKLAKS